MPPTIPLATYRLQLTKNFDFDDAANLVSYLKTLGITHLYASPFLKARPGSTHGYDIVDHDRLNPELGGEAAFNRLSRTLKEHDLGLILDFVPNHMASAAPTMPGGWTCSNRARDRPTRKPSTSIGTDCGIGAIPAFCSRSSAALTATSCSPAKSS